jgi:ATP/maltotriose-dependent transcriptional regulator MalT/DNA-binding SARP family transcriptional activator
MKSKTDDIAHTIYKISKPEVVGVIQRKGLFSLLDKLRKKPIVWISGMPGSGKTTFVVNYLKSRKIPYIYYHLDEGDNELSTFFYYLGMAANDIAPKPLSQNRSKKRYAQSLPLLTPEHLQDIPAFTSLFFNEFYSRFDRQNKFVVVFDNYQDIPPDSILHKVISAGVSIISDCVPQCLNFIFISKGEPPAAFSHLRTGDRIGFITDQDMRFTMDETMQFLHKRGLKKIGVKDAKQFQDKVQGWAAGLVLLMEKYRKEDTHLIQSEIFEERFFHYFADEIFNKIDKNVQDFLLRTSFLPKITLDMAEKLTGMKHPEDLLARLHLNNYFTIKISSLESTYHYHSLFREFLLVQANKLFKETEVREIRKKAAELLEQSGEIEEAAKLFQASKDWQALTMLILNNAQALITQGRNQILLQWLKQLPGTVLDNTPWLLYWYGVSVLPFSLTDSRKMLEKAFTLFQEQQDQNSRNGLFLSWAGVARTYCIEWDNFEPLDHWIEVINGLLAHVPFPSGQIEAHFISVMLLALIYRKPQYKNIAPWVRRAEALVQSQNGKHADKRTMAMLTNYLLMYYSWTGDIAKMDVLVDMQKAVIDKQRTGQDAINNHDAITPLEAILGQVIKCIYLWFTVSPQTLSAIEEGLSMASGYGVHLWDHMFFAQGAYYVLTTGEVSAAEKYLESMFIRMDKNHTLDVSHYYYLKSYHSHLQGNLPVAMKYGEEALQAAIQAGALFPEAINRLGLAQVQVSSKDYREARKNLVQARHIGDEMRSVVIEFYCCLLAAQIDFELGDEPGGIRQLREGMKIGREHGYINHWRWMSDIMSQLCMKALQSGIEVPYVQMLIKRRGLVPKNSPWDRSTAQDALHFVDTENWPWTLKIHTLGSFIISKDEGALSFSGKVQKTPLNMLKVLVASGGRDVREEVISDALWPDSEGDKTHSAFSTTLQRLRLLIGNDTCLQLKEGRLSLDPQYCWVDVWAFEHLLDRADQFWNSTGEDAAKLTEQAVALYKGGFLPNDTDQWWTTSMRERIKSKFIRSISRLGSYLEQRGQWREALEYYQKGLEADNLSEEFYQSLMLCYQSMGRTGEALAVYNRCKKTLLTILNISPSPKTESMYQKIKESLTPKMQ